MADDQTLKYTFDADASKFVSEAKKAKAAAEDVGKASSSASGAASGRGGGPGSKQATANINEQTKAWEQHAQKVQDVAAKYRMLEQARSRFEKNPQAIGEINKQQVQLLKTMERSAQNEQEYSKALQARLNLQKQMGDGYSAHSNRQFSQLQGLGLAAGAMALRGLGQVGGQLYQTSIGSYQDFNNQFMFDPALIASQNKVANAQFGLGKQLSGYQQAQNNVGAAIYGSPFGPALAIGGDILGKVSGPASAALSLAAIYRSFKGGSAVAKGAGAAADAFGAAGGAAKAGSGVSRAAEVINAGTGAVEASTVVKIGEAVPAVGKFAEALGAAGKLLGPVAKVAGPVGLGLAVLDKFITAVHLPAYLAGTPGFMDTVDSAQKNGKLTQDEADGLKRARITHTPTGIPFLSEIAGIGGLSKEQEDALLKKAGIDDAGNKVEPSKLDEVKDTKAFQRVLSGIRNQISDFQVDQGRQTFETQRNYARQQEDISRNRQYANQDYSIQQQKFGIQGGRINFDYSKNLGRAYEDYSRNFGRNEEDFSKNTNRTLEDYARNVERVEIGIFRTRRDYAIQSERLQEDYTRQSGRLLEDYTRQVNRTQEDFNRTIGRAQQDYTKTLSRAYEDYTRTVSRAQEDYTRTVSRTQEDFNRTIGRAQQDYNRTTVRAIEDYGVTAGRATDDANRDRLRSDQDYSRSRLELERNTARSLSDINRGLKEGLISILAPGLASSQGYQLAKLFSDTSRQKQRLGEDTQFQSQGLDLNYARQQEDILRNESRTLADAMRGLSRGLQDANISLSRAMEDASVTYQRSLEDASVSLTRSLEDASLSYSRTLEDAGITLDRTLQDASLSFSRAMEDASLTFSRGMQDLNLEQARASFDALKAANDSLLDASLSLRDANISEARSLEDTAIQHTRALQDIDLNYSRGLADIQTEYTRAVQDLVLQEKDAAKDHERTLADLALSEKRGKEDFEFAMDGIKIAGDRFTRDMLLSLGEFDQTWATELSSSLGAIQEITNEFRAQMGQQVATPQTGSGSSGTFGGVPDWGTPHAKGLNYVPYAEYPARLHPGEMVVTRQESETLRQAGYRPESRNLGTALQNLFMKGVPGFEGGFNGTMSDESFFNHSYGNFNHVDPADFFWPDGHGGYVSTVNDITRNEAAAYNALFANRRGVSSLNPGATAGNYAYGSGGNISISGGSGTGISRALPAPSVSRSIPQLVSSSFNSAGQPQLVIKPTFMLNTQDQLTIALDELARMGNRLGQRIDNLAQSQALRTGRY